MTLDSTLKLNNCPHCWVDTPNLVSRHTLDTDSDEKDEPQKWGVYACVRCGGVILALSYPPSTEVIETYPSTEVVNQALPEQVKRFLGQAMRTLSTPDASVIMSNSAVDMMLKEKGYDDPKASVYHRIIQAVTDGLLTEEMGEWAHDIRLESNNPRHADLKAIPAELSDAKRCLEFAKVLGEFLFVLPSKVKRGLKNEVDDQSKRRPKFKQPTNIKLESAYRSEGYSKVLKIGKFDTKPNVSFRIMYNAQRPIAAFEKPKVLEAVPQSGKPRYWETNLLIESCESFPQLGRIEIFVNGQTAYVGEFYTSSSPQK
ncbi:DUF4145 domain-containing protein [Spirosoma oryzicola]|uniref:DUF4145 domain-containing protein n=1 Tax=Spirosoma oryzicola TaxID=2898794 RepID=UPI001E2A0141|nr:DUF4145 domain-containing protein [Spirosoma oryzicola]UHG92531.1 DUF4145 domain-containing protein [Spirosoma oryzicola]